MKLGTITTEIRRSTIEETFDAMVAYGMLAMQLSFASVCGEEMPAAIPASMAKRVGNAARERGMNISCVSGTFNMAHPDPAVRAEGLRRFEGIAAACADFGCDVITICTGSRHPESMWRWHDDNLLPAAWEDMLETAYKMREIVLRYHVRMGLETEASNVVNCPEKARKLLDALGSDSVGIILDPANLFQAGEADPARVRAVLDHAFDLLGQDILLAHGKDILAGPGIAFTAAGQGIVDFPYFLSLLTKIGYSGDLIIHGVKQESRFPASIAHIRTSLKLPV
jgi:sugar phosphate isomerase/epimerase